MTRIEPTQTTARISKIVHDDGMIFLCGQTAKGAGNPDIEGQTVEVLARVDRLLGRGGKRLLAHALSHGPLKAIDDFAMMNGGWEAWLMPGTTPARTTVEAKLASPELLVEVTVIATASNRG
jgi:enamine deaminase RidA (YjgF/YER057c/UK114 family)